MPNQNLVVTLWRTYSRGRRDSHTWRSFVDTFVAQPEVVRNKRRVAGFSLASFEGNYRALSRVEKVFALTLDFDEGDTALEQAEHLLPKRKAVAYTTFSHTEHHPKLRVIYPLWRPVDAREYEIIWLWAQKRIGAKHVLDESAQDASRFWFLPSHAPGAPYAWRELEGQTLDLEKVVAAAAGSPSSRLLSARSQGVSLQTLVSPPLLSGSSRVSVPIGEAEESFFGRAFAAAGLAFRTLDNGALSVACPWASTHSSGSDDDTSTVVLPPVSGEGWGIFHCSHAHCARRSTLDLLDALPSEALDTARREHGIGLVRAKIRAGFVQRLEGAEEIAALERFVLRCYPNGATPPLVWTVKIGSRAHEAGLNSLPLMALRGQRVDLAVRGKREITWGRLVPNEVFIPRSA